MTSRGIDGEGENGHTLPPLDCSEHEEERDGQQGETEGGREGERETAN